MLVLTFLRANKGLLAFVAATIFGVLLLVQTTEYGRALLTRYRLGKQQAQAAAASTRQQAATTARYTGYRLDSVRAATQRQQLLQDLSNYQENDKKIDRNRLARVPLPAFESMPRE